MDLWHCWQGPGHAPREARATLNADVEPAARQDNSLLQMPPWSNPWLLAAMALSFGLHFVILYVPALASIFSIVPLSLNEWVLVLLFAAPVVLIDEALKLVGRHFVNRCEPRLRGLLFSWTGCNMGLVKLLGLVLLHRVAVSE